ncbi:Ctr copper transporter [Suillus bovinus]|uniref:Ctr copper transporter n=1 Tax=Suillus bovinus TaxID=48563 RepID=UPI001B863C99|nr:Ctr copper transporter [Suillus bovinus]KAG2160079.1 Ctr copper transporter [Suillus bovinus]
MMTPWLHFSGGDYLIFKTWMPESKGAITGACIALVAFCILERWISAFRRQMEIQWGVLALLLQTQRNSDDAQHIHDKPKDSSDGIDAIERSSSLPFTPTTVRSRSRLVPPFIPMQDIPRGILQAVQSLFSYALMLAVMTFNASYIISIIVGLAIGEILFGRIGRLNGGRV